MPYYGSRGGGEDGGVDAGQVGSAACAEYVILFPFRLWVGRILPLALALFLVVVLLETRGKATG